MSEIPSLNTKNKKRLKDFSMTEKRSDVCKNIESLNFIELKKQINKKKSFT